jgi:hypothetical protein
MIQSVKGMKKGLHLLGDFKRFMPEAGNACLNLQVLFIMADYRAQNFI